MITTEEEAIIRAPRSEPIISWGAIFAGLAFIVAGSVLLTLLGGAIGVSIADASDLDAVGAGFAVSAAVWIVLTALVVNFVGGLLAAHLSGRMTHASGLMHGVIVWAVGFVVIILIEAAMVRGTAGAGVKVAETSASMAGAVGGALVSGAATLGQGAQDIAGSAYIDEMRASLRRAAIESISEMDPPGGAEVSRSEVRQAIQELDAELLQEVAAQIVTGDTEQAKNTLQQELGLSDEEIDEIIDGVSERARQFADDSELAQRAGGWLDEQLDEAAARVSQAAGQEVSRSELKAAMDELDGDTLTSAAQALLTGDTEGAKNIIAANTSLDENEIEAIVDGVNDEMAAARSDLQERFDNTVESISDYVQALLWLYFFTAALSLGAAALGGFLGASGLSRGGYDAAVASRTTVSDA